LNVSKVAAKVSTKKIAKKIALMKKRLAKIKDP
jgi:hypothetical protein